MKAIDLFCGCGGISAGLKMSGFDVLAGADIEENYRITFSHNFKDALSFGHDLSQVLPQEFMRQVGVEPEELDLLVGGPPCQGFSKNVPRKFRHLDSDNNKLIRIYLDYCEAIKPKMILMENVAEMKNGFDSSYTNEILDRLSNVGYEVSKAIINAADLGVPQRRRRAFFMASRDGVKFAPPVPTHIKATDKIGLFSAKEYVTVWEAIGDLPSLEHGGGEEITDYVCSPFSEYQKIIRGKQTSVKNHVSRFLQPKQLARLAALNPGEGHKDLPKELQVKSGYSGAYGRLTKDMIAPTITRWVFHPGSGRWGHPVDTRVLTIREAARIQGFPDDFEFVGSYTQQAGQLGNAVPPLLAKQIVESMVLQLNNYLAVDKKSKSAAKETFSSAEGKRKVAA